MLFGSFAVSEVCNASTVLCYIFSKCVNVFPGYVWNSVTKLVFSSWVSEWNIGV